MAKQSGLGDNLYISGYDLSGDVLSVDTIHGGTKPLEVTGIDKSAIERLGGVRDGGMDITTALNDTAGQAYPRLSALPTADVVMTYCRGTTLGNSSACLVAKQLNHDATRGSDGMLTFKVSAQANAFGLEWGNQLTAGKRVDTVGTNGTGVDLTTVSTAFGWQAYLQVFALTGTNVIATIQDSADNAAFANLSGGAFTSAVGITSQRLASASATDTVRRYLRIVSSGTFSSATFAVTFVRNASLTAF